MFPGLFFGLQLFQTIYQFLLSAVSQELIDRACASELLSLSTHPHLSYGIVSGSGIKPNVSLALSHIGPVATFLGSAWNIITVNGAASRSGRHPFIPLVSRVGVYPKKIWIGTVSEQRSEPLSVWHAQVRFKAVYIPKVAAPVLTLDSVTAAGAVYMGNLVSSGIILGPPLLTFLSSLYHSFAGLGSDAKHYDVTFAMTPAALTLYNRVE